MPRRVVPMAPETLARFAGGILFHVIRHHQVSFITDPQIRRRHGDAAGGEVVDFLEEGGGVEDDAVADHVHFAGAKDADGEEVG